jgi:biopolymer transport protein ExbD
MNMTPLIDVTFLLLTFFMLATHFASAEKIDLDLPRPDDSQATEQRFPDRILINLLYQGDDQEPEIRLGPMQVDSLERLGQRLKELARINPQAQVILRADRRLGYGAVRSVMELVAANRLGNLQIVAELESGQSGGPE